MRAALAAISASETPAPSGSAVPGTTGTPARVAAVARTHAAERLIVGLPLRLDGTHGPEAAAARKLADAIRRESGLPVELVDERLTTAAAERALIAGGVKREQRRQGIDRVAATMLLQSHLDHRRRQKPG